MKCNKCEFYKKVVLSYLDSNNVETDLGLRLIQCEKMKEELINKNLYLNEKSTKTCNIGTIKEFNCSKYQWVVNLHNGDFLDKQNINTPEWCPI